MKILMTGARGFVGRHLHAELERNGYNVEAIDLDDGDLTQNGVFAAQLDRVLPDMVIHLAAQVGRLFGEDDLRHTLTSNALMTTLVANACGARGVRLMYFSTSEVYGDQGERLCDEAGPLTLSHNFYGVTKLWGEQACQLYAPRELQIVRLSMPYGPGMLPGRGRAAIVNMLWQANTGQRIVVHRGAERAWCWIHDSVAGVRRVIERGEMAMTAPESQAGIGVYNVGRADNPAAMVDVARLACKVAGADDGLISEVHAPGMQTVVKRLDDTKLRALGWVPQVDLDEGMRRLFADVRRYDRHGFLRADGELQLESRAA